MIVTNWGVSKGMLVKLSTLLKAMFSPAQHFIISETSLISDASALEIIIPM